MMPSTARGTRISGTLSKDGEWLHRIPESAVRVACAVGLLGLAGCTSIRETLPDRSAIEQLLVSTAVDRMIERLEIAIPDGTKLFVDNRVPDGFDAAYAVGALRDRLARAGTALVANRAEAEMIIEFRVGTMSIDKTDSLIGIPQYDVPVPLTSGFVFPELALWKRELQVGVAKAAITAIDADSGRLHHSTRPVYGFAYRANYDALFFFSWTSDDLIPEDSRPRRRPIW